jgi:hypothetical protein
MGWRLGGVGTVGVVACVQEVAVTPGELLADADLNLWDASVKFMRPRRSDKTLLHVLKAKGDCVAERQFETAMSGWRGAGSDRQLDGLVLRQNQLALAAGRQLQYQLALPWLSP